jgi:nitroreductase
MTDKRSGTNDFWEALYTQRAIRAWTDAPVPDDVLLKIIEAGTKAPSGTNTQPWRFLVVRDQATRTKMSDLIRERFQANAGFQDYLKSHAESDDRSRRLMGKSAMGIFENLAQAPVFIFPCLFRGEGAPLGEPTLFAGSSIYGAVQNLQLAARALGIGTVMTTMQAQIEPEVREMLKIPDNAKPVALIPLGYPAANFGPTTRIPAAEVTYFETWGTVAG